MLQRNHIQCTEKMDFYCNFAKFGFDDFTSCVMEEVNFIVNAI